MSSRRITVLTDLHLRSDSLPGFLQKQVETAERIANFKKSDAIILNGDIFHHRNPRSEEILAFRDLLNSFNCKEVFVNRGNHDTLRKDGSSETILRVFSDLAEIIVDSRTVEVAGIPIDFIPHYEDEDRIISDIKSCNSKIMFGHFGYNRCVRQGGSFFKSKIRKEHMKSLTFLGHIHSPKDNGNIYIIGTPYSSSFHEANQKKKTCDIIVYGDEIEVTRRPIEFGIKHISTRIDTIEQDNVKFGFKNFFTVLRVKLDKLDAFAVRQIKDDILDKYSVRHLEFDFDNILPKMPSRLCNVPTMVAVDDNVIDEYIKSSNTIFENEELWDGLKEIRNASEQP